MNSPKEIEASEPNNKNNDYYDTSSLVHLESQNTAATSIFAARYKARPQLTQEDRREKLLQAIKLRRSQTLNEKRGLVELFDEQEASAEDLFVQQEANVEGLFYEQEASVENVFDEQEASVEGLCDEQEASVEDLEMEDVEPEQMEVEVRRRRKRKKRRNLFCNKLMLSEWLTEIPFDLEYKWVVKPCPVGVRNLVVARNKITKVYNRKGMCQAAFQSDLPGGGTLTPTYGRFTVLDCIFNRQTQCYYVLDVLAWNNYSLRPCDSDFRFYWLKSKFDEAPQLREKSVHNKYSFYEVRSFPAELPLIQDKLSRPFEENNEALELDGLLFYHREADYTEGITPLVGWLKPYMLPEMLHLPVDESFMESKPGDYVSMQQFINSHCNKRRRTAVDNANVEME